MALPTRAAIEADAKYSSGSDERFRIDFVTFFPLVASAVLINITTITALQNTKGRLFDISELQLLFLGAAVVLMLLSALMVTSKNELRFTVEVPDQGEGLQATIMMVFAFSVARLGAMVGAISSDRLWRISMSATAWDVAPVVYVSAIYEDLLFSVGLGTGLYITFFWAFKQVFEDEMIANVLAMLVSSTILGIAFAFIHIGAYGLSPDVFGYLFGARFVYAMSYFITKNAAVPVGAHILHNLSIVFFGI